MFGGRKFEPLNFYAHESVTEVEFNESENFVLSFNNTCLYISSLENYIVWVTLLFIIIFNLSIKKYKYVNLLFYFLKGCEISRESSII